MGRVLVACEFSGVVRRAFAARGHDAWSCDLLPAEDRSNKHIVGDVRDILEWGWDMLIVAHPPCFIGDTLVLTSEGYRPISEISVGDKVLTHKGRWRRVTEVMSKPASTLTRIKSTNGLETYTTPEHPYYTRYRVPYAHGFRTKAERDQPARFVAAGDLTPQHFTGSVLPPAQPVEISDDDLWLMGRYVADGHLRDSRWTPGKFEEMVISIGAGKLPEFRDRVTRKVTYSETRTATRATFYGHDDIAPFAQFGRGAVNKKLPTWVLSLPVEQARVFLEGYLSGDGYIREKSISASTVSAELALGIAMLMQLVFNKCPSIRTSEPRASVTIEGREVQTRAIHHIEVPQSDVRLRNYVSGDYAWGHVREVEEVTQPTLVYNLSVEEDETYTANGLVVHNCTRLCNSGVRWLHRPPTGRSLDDIWRELDEGAELFSALWQAPIPRRCIENPVMHRYAKERIRDYRPPAQSIQPWQFGDPESKRTCLWLHNLPPLEPTVTQKPDAVVHRVHRMPPGPDRSRERSRFFPGVAAAMADQWGPLIEDEPEQVEMQM